MPTSRPKYIPCSYMDPVGYARKGMSVEPAESTCLDVPEATVLGRRKYPKAPNSPMHL